MLPQQHALSFPFSAREVVELGRLHAVRQTAAQERAIASEALAACGASALAPRSYAQLSGGERARVQLARVLAQIWRRSEERSVGTECVSLCSSRWSAFHQKKTKLDRPNNIVYHQ